MSSRSKKRPSRPSRHVVGYARARSWLARQLADDPSLAFFWKDGPGGSRTGMLWILSSCAQPDCPCRDVFVEARTVPDSLASGSLTADEGMQMMLVPDPKGLAGPVSKRKAYLVIDIDTGAMKPSDEGPQDEHLLDWIKAELDEPVMAMLRAAWATAKGKKAEAAASPR